MSPRKQTYTSRLDTEVTLTTIKSNHHSDCLPKDYSQYPSTFALFNVAIPTTTRSTETDSGNPTAFADVLMRQARVLEEMTENIKSLDDVVATTKEAFMQNLTKYMTQFNDHAYALQDVAKVREQRQM